MLEVIIWRVMVVLYILFSYVEGIDIDIYFFLIKDKCCLYVVKYFVYIGISYCIIVDWFVSVMDY